ncbi:hypothetical protein ACLMJK_001679 [Lecanora helva]
MQSTLLVATALFSVLSLSQSNNFNINTAEASRVASDVANFITTLEKSPAFQTDVAAVLAAAPASVIQEAASDPEALLDDLSSTDPDDLPDWVTAIPTSVLGSLETLVAKPVDAVSDVADYAGELADDPQVSSALEILATALPTSVQSAVNSDPIGFLDSVATATTLPAWLSDIPAPVQTEIGGVVNGALSIVAADLEGSAKPTGGSFPSGGAARPTGTGFSSVVGSSNGTKPTGTPAAPSPTAFQGMAASMKSAGVAMAVVVAGAGLLLNV